MRTWSQKLLLCKKHFIRVFSFLFLFTMSWFAWVWLIPPQPRAIIVPLTDSKCVAFTPDSGFLITREPQWYSPPGSMSVWDERSCPSRIQVWDVQNGTLLHTFSDEWTDMEEVTPTPDSRRLIGWVSGEPEKSPDLIETCDLLSGGNSKRVTLPAKAHSFARLEFSPDDKWLIVAPKSGVMYQGWLWQIGSDNLVRFDGIGPTMAFSENGEHVVVANKGDGGKFTVKVWPLNDFTRPWKEYTWSADRGMVFPGGRTAATYRVESFKIAEAKLWDLASGRLLATFPVSDRQDHIRFLNFPAGNRIVTNYVDCTATGSTAIWDINGQPKLTSVFHGFQIATSKDRNWMLQSEEMGVHLVDLRSRKGVSLTDPTDTPASNQGAPGQFSPDSRMVVVTGIHRNVKLNSDFKRLCSFLSIKTAKEWGPVARLWAVETRAEVANFDGCTEVLFAPDSKTLATLQEDGTVHLWDIPARRATWPILGSAIALWLLSFLGARTWERLRREKPRTPARPQISGIAAE
jgi:WD40 repeat protein